MSDTERKLPIRCNEHGMTVSAFRGRPGSESASLGCPRCIQDWPELPWQPLNDFGLPVPPTLKELIRDVAVQLCTWKNGTQTEEVLSVLGNAIERLEAHPDWKGE